jgi:hypothetical protein
MACHNPQANFVLGFSPKQLNLEIASGRTMENQLLRFAKAGMFAAKLQKSQLRKLPRFVSLKDNSASVQERMRSYLDSNCAHCHRPELALSVWDGRSDRSLAKQRIVNSRAIMHAFADEDAKGIAPGDLEHSYLYLRMKSTEPFMRMPPLGSNVVHHEAVALMKAWIKSMPPKDELSKEQTVDRQMP